MKSETGEQTALLGEGGAEFDAGRDGPRSGAVLSPCGTYRYQLWRRWGDGGACNFLMLNPSTADATQDDPTIRRCIRYAQEWGYGSLIVTNLFALRATDPRALRQHPDPIGPANDAHLLNSANDAALIVCAWGEHGALQSRGWSVSRLLLGARSLYCLARNKSGQPVHPLYQPASAKPVPLRVHPSEPSSTGENR